MAETNQQLWRLSAIELGAAYRSGATTPEAVLAAVMARLEEVNPRINAVVTIDRAGAERSARESTRRWKEGRSFGSLDGVPITVKDSILVGGIRATWGSRIYADHVPELDETPVAHLRDAGAVIVGKTNVPEFTLHGYTDNELFGVTRNPWDPSLTAGGSSGGAAAAVASGIGPLALGTDGGGSIRRPAAHTGLVGFKPSTAMVPRSGGFPAILHDFEVVGPLARCVGDVSAIMDVIAGPRWSATRDLPARPMRVLHISAFGDAPVDETIGRAGADIAGNLAAIGHSVMHVPRFDLASPVNDIWPVISCSGLSWLLSKHENAEVGKEIAELSRRGAGYLAADYVEALRAIDAMKKEFGELFQQVDVLLTPTTAAMPWPAAEVYPREINGRPVGPRGHAVFTAFANILGLPAISLPCPREPRVLPIGFQLCMPNGRDAELLALAAACEREIAKPYAWPC